MSSNQWHPRVASFFINNSALLSYLGNLQNSDRWHKFDRKNFEWQRPWYDFDLSSAIPIQRCYFIFKQIRLVLIDGKIFKKIQGGLQRTKLCLIMVNSRSWFIRYYFLCTTTYLIIFVYLHTNNGANQFIENSILLCWICWCYFLCFVFSPVIWYNLHSDYLKFLFDDIFWY